MVKKLLSLAALFVMAFSAGAQSQSLSSKKFDVARLAPRYSAGQVVTSKIDLKGNEYWDGYWDGTLGEYSILLGVESVPMDYDCAAMFPASSAKVSGKTVEGIRFGFPNSTNIKNVKVWMSTTLPKTPEEADIICQEVKDITGSENEADELNEVRFTTPYTVDPDKDLYVGYSFYVASGSEDAENFPIIIDSSKELANGLILKFGGAEGKWDDYNGYGFGVLSVQMLLSGESYSDAASIKSDLGTHVGTLGSKFNLPLTIENTGENQLNSLQLSVELDGNVSTLDISSSDLVKGENNAYGYNLAIDAPAETGSYDLKISVSKVNGIDNPVKAVAKGNLFVVSRLVEMKPFIEEFTGMWCGYCPRGTIAMEKFRQVYGDKVSLVAIHAGDALQCVDYADVSQNVSGFPAAHVNRIYTNIDPYFGKTAKTAFGIKELVEECMSVIPAAAVEASAVIDGDVLTATSEVEFLFTGDASNFAVAYIITEDGLYNDSWEQKNYYSNSAPDGLVDEPLFERWMNGPSKMAVEYNEVAIAAQGILRGVENSVPETVQEGVKNSHSVEFNLKDYKLIQDRDRLTLITVLFDKVTGAVVNSNYVYLNPEASGIDGIETDGDKVETARYTVDGRRIIVPEKGVNIVKYSDGTYRKVVVE